MKKTDILFIKPGSQKQLYGELSTYQLTAIEPPMWAALLTAYMRDKGYHAHLVDAEVENKNYEQTAILIDEIDPVLVVIVVSGTNPSASTMNMTGAGMILKYLKSRNPGIRTALAGLHPSALPKRTLVEENVDFVVVGEGFYTLPSLVDALKFKHDKFNIPGLWYKQHGEVHSNPRAPLFDDLNELPVPAWDLLPMNNYRAHNWHCFENINERSPYGVIYTSLGCPFKCSFCCINALFGKPGIRYRKPEIVVQEIDYLVDTWNIRNFKILDEMFVMKESHVTELCDLIIERQYDLNIWAYARVNTVNERVLMKMKQAGIHWVALGFESGSESVLRDVSKGYKLAAVQSVVKTIADTGIYLGANFMFGLPEDNEQTMRATLDLAKEINAEWANFNVTMAYPGSKLYETALDKGWALPDTWQGYSQYSYETLPLPTKYVSGSRVLTIRDQAFKEYFSNPLYLDKIKSTFGQETVNYIHEMLKKDLKRKYVAP